MPKWIVAIVSAAFAIIIGFACGALLTVPDVVESENTIAEVKRSHAELTQARDKLRKDLENAMRNNKELERKITWHTDENDALIQKITQAIEENTALRRQVAELKERNEFLIKAITK